VEFVDVASRLHSGNGPIAALVGGTVFFYRTTPC